MTDPIREIQARIAYKLWDMRGRRDGNDVYDWNEAGKIINHFLNRRPESSDWQSDEEDWRPMFSEIIYG